MRKALYVAFIIVLLQFFVAIYLYPSMPDAMAIHWNVQGEADGYGSKLVGLFLIPAIELVLIPIFLVLPRIDPKASQGELMGSYDWFIMIFTFYMAYVFGLSVVWNLGYRFDLLRLLVPMLGVMFIGVGEILGKVEMNWFMGIRTPWTLSSQQVWTETHRLGGKLFKISGALTFLGVFFSGWTAFLLAILPVLLSGIYVTLYSYILYKKEKQT
jgi:uncharacterized membrane protein